MTLFFILTIEKPLFKVSLYERILNCLILAVKLFFLFRKKKFICDSNFSTIDASLSECRNNLSDIFEKFNFSEIVKYLFFLLEILFSKKEISF